MNVIVEISDRFGMDYYLVSVTITTRSLQLDSPERYYKIWHQETPYRQTMEWRLTQQEGIQETSFTWQEISYRFVDCGTGIVSCLI